MSIATLNAFINSNTNQFSTGVPLNGQYRGGLVFVCMCVLVCIFASVYVCVCTHIQANWECRKEEEIHSETECEPRQTLC